MLDFLAQVPAEPIRTPELDFWPLVPELILAGGGILVLLTEAVFKKVSRTALLWMTIVVLAAAGVASAMLWDWDGPASVLGGMIATDRFGVFARLILIGVGLVAVLFTHQYFGKLQEGPGEIYALILFAVSGMTLMAVGLDLIVIFLALEIFSLSLYVMTGLSLRLTAGEASMKYFLLGAFSSAFFLFGVAMSYGATATTSVSGIATALTGQSSVDPIAVIAIGLLLVGFAFKVGAVPFHMWTPDVYQGAPTPITAFMAAATKVAAFAALMRVLNVAFQPLGWDWEPVVWVVAALTMIVGSYLAVTQTDIKRMLAYSSIAHAGFVLTGLTAADRTGVSAALFYLMSYAIMTLGAFGTVMLISARGERNTSLDAYRGLARRSPGMAGLLTLFLLSMAGIPPTVGFIAKASVFGAAVGAGNWSLVLIATLSSVVAASFYLRVVVLMYMESPAAESAEPDRSLSPASVLVAVSAVLVLVLGVFPGLVWGFVQSASALRW